MSIENDQHTGDGMMTSQQAEPRGEGQRGGTGPAGADGFDATGELSAEMTAQIDSAMGLAMGERPGRGAGEGHGGGFAGDRHDGGQHGGQQGGHDGHGSGHSPEKPKLRGPRVVQGGREHRSGAVVSVGPSDIFVEFGPKELGVVERLQFKDKEGNEPNLPKVGDQLQVVVQRHEPGENLFICVLPGTVQKADWEMLEAGQVVEARVVGVNKGGLELEVAGHQAFMPASQVSYERIPDLSVLVGEKLECQVQRIDRRGRGNIVLSRRELLAEQRAQAAGKLRDALQEGMTVEGTVRKIMDFGAFVDLGGVDGLIHLNDLSHDRVNHGAKNVSRHVTEGQTVRVQIIKIDWDANRISLGLKQLHADPFASAAEVIEGAVLTGKVTSIADFGCFIEVAPGVEGLVHISEIDYKRINKVEDAVQLGEIVQVRVLKVDQQGRRVSLSIKQAKAPPEPVARPEGQGAGGGGGPGGPRGGGGGGGFGGGFGGGRGRGGRVERDTRTPDEILKETPALRRMREEAKKKAAKEAERGKGGLGSAGGLGIGLGDLRL